MAKKKRHFTVYWEEEEKELMEQLAKVARLEKRSKSSTALIALKEYVKRFFEDEEDSES